MAGLFFRMLVFFSLLEEFKRRCLSVFNVLAAIIQGSSDKLTRSENPYQDFAVSSST